MESLLSDIKGAVVVTLCQNEAEVKFKIEIDHQISPTEKAGTMSENP